MTASPIETAPSDSSANASNRRSTKGRWKIGAALLSIACLAQAILWTMWWDDPTHFKMSILFVWPAGLFSLLIWWTFFSGWSGRVRYGSVIAGIVSIVAFFSVYRPDRFDGDMVPTRLAYRWEPTATDKSREFVKTLKLAADEQTEVTEEAPLVAIPSDWPGFRGPARDGIVQDTTIRTDWSANPPKEIWRHPVGKAWSSFAVVDDYVFTQEQRDDMEAVVAYRLEDGQQRWQHLDKALFQAGDFQGGVGPRATPQFNEGRLYTLGATGILNCLDARSGKRVWTADILKDAGTDGQPVANLAWGMAGSPLVVDQFVIVNPGGAGGKSVAAYDKVTGQKVWCGGDQPASYSSPSLGQLHNEQIVLMPLGTGLGLYSFTNGKELSFFPWKNDPKVNTALPLVLNDNSVVFGTGYGVGTVRLDVQLEGGTWSVKQRWHSNRFRPKFNDFVVRQGYLYGLDDGRLSCLDVDSGELKWKAGRYGYGQILLVDDLLLILSEEGNVVLIPAPPTQPVERARFSALQGGITWNHPVVAHGKLLVRNANEAACFDVEAP